jgi:glycine/D-amino acid oxidase-like deaminating enzyme
VTPQPRLPSWWLEDALAREDRAPAAPALAGDASADVAIVGGGYTGLWTALALAERTPDLRVTLVEAEICGAGPSGRNGGFCHGYWSALSSVLPVLGIEDSLRLCRAGERIVPAVRALGEDVWLRDGGRLDVSAAPAQDGSVDRSVEAARSVGHPEEAVRLSREELSERVRSPVFRSAVSFRDGATVHQGLLVRALRRRALASGVAVHEHAPALRVRQGEVETRAGVLRAPEIVLATNAALTSWKPASRSLTNFGSYVVLTEPVPELLEQIGWTGGEAIVDGRMFVHYFRTLDDGRVLMGSGSGPIGFGGRIDDRFSRDRPTGERAEAGLRRLLSGLDGARIERSWGGPIDVSADHLPFFGTKPGTRIHYGAGYSGHGVGPSWLGGQILASLVLGADDWSRLPLVTRRVPSLPPEPLRRIGGGLVRASIMACEEAEERGERPPLYARAGAAIPRLVRMELGTR